MSVAAMLDGYTALDSALAMAPANRDQPAGQQHRANTPAPHPHADMNPSAPPFSPVAGPPHCDEQPSGDQQPRPSSTALPWRANNAPPQPCPTRPPHVPWHANYAQAHVDSAAQTLYHHDAYLDYAAQAYYHQWAQYYACLGYPSHALPYGGQPPAFVHQGQANYSHAAAAHQYPHMQSQPNLAASASDPELNDLNQTADGDGSTKQQKEGRGKKKDGGRGKQDGGREKQDKAPDEPRAMTAKERRKDIKIHLPAPPPAPLYLQQAAEEPSTLDTPGQMLVILDLNGTLIYRPNRNAKSMIARPFLKPFLRYLFSNFNVMVWSSARPQNVDSLVGQCLDKELRSRLVAEWARDSFGLSPEHYNLNVQVYKNLNLVWNSDIQQKHPFYTAGQRFGQHNTVLIDDSSLKANAQPHNLIEIPEFKASHTDSKQDVLREVAGYLEVLRKQADVSKFIHKDPFKFDGRWQYDWPAEVPDSQGGKLENKVSLETVDSQSTFTDKD